MVSMMMRKVRAVTAWRMSRGRLRRGDSQPSMAVSAWAAIRGARALRVVGRKAWALARRCQRQEASSAVSTPRPQTTRNIRLNMAPWSKSCA